MINYNEPSKDTENVSSLNPSRINYNEPVTIEHMDMGSYEAKFVFVDKVRERIKELVPKGKQLHPKFLAKIHDDYTMFAYMYLKDNDNEPLRLYHYQDMILADDYNRIYFRAANQIGKSFLFNVKAVKNLVTDHGHAHNEAIVSKSLPQSTYQMQRVKQLLKTMTISWKEEGIKKSGSDSLTKITFDVTDKNGDVKYTNMLVCTPCTEGLLGYDLHELNLDEFEYWTDVDLKWFYNQIAQPRLYTTKGRILIMTNPNGKDSFGNDLEQQLDTGGTKRFHTYVFNYLDRPANTEEEMTELKHQLSRQEFESTVAAVRSISSMAYFSPDEIDRSYDKGLTELSMVGKQPFFFLDVGAKHDRSCLVGGYTEISERFIDRNPQDKEESYRFNNVCMPIIHMYPQGYPITRVAGVLVDDSDGWHYEKSVKEYIDEWSNEGITPMFGYDITGNQGMKALFESIGVFGDDVTFSGPNKSGMYQRFKYIMEKGLLRRIKHKEWESEAAQVIATKGQRGYLLINAASHVRKGGKTEDAKLKKIPDDCMDATAGFIHLADPKDTIEPSLTVF